MCRRSSGGVHYRLCLDCAGAVITGIVIDGRFLSTGLGTRVLSHLSSRHPGLSWRSTLSLRTTRDLLRRMRVPVTTASGRCPLTRPA
ncbi:MULTISPECIES: N-acetyltransferase [Streptomyces]|uniref:N-acetyltransferase n=1 Tax=Streptomyces TaxID=1883 RepID=UPI0021A793DB|nr:N-acetyltransferase [Streptomyces sp. 2132.2]